jgi:hypothetical protein
MKYVNRDQKGRFASNKYKKVMKKYDRNPKDLAFKEFRANAMYVALVIAVFMLALFVREENIAKHKLPTFIPTVEAATFEPISYVEPEIVEIVEVAPIVVEEVCNLSFQSLKPADIYKNIVVTPPAEFSSNLGHYSCKEQQILSRLAWYESEWKSDSVNIDNPYANGYYHILPTSREVCYNNGVQGYEDCALWIYNNFRSWFLSVTTYPNSFNF